MATQPQEAMPSVNPRRQAVVRLLRNRKAMFGLFCLTIITLSAVFAPFITTHDPDRQNVRNRLQGSSAEHWLGTDHLGRDVFARIVYGGRVSLQVGFVSVGIALVFGGTMGLVSRLLRRLAGIVYHRASSTSCWRFPASCWPWPSSPHLGPPSPTS